MFKAMMIIFIVTIGYDGKKQDRVGDVDVVLFETMAQCEFAKKTIDEILPFGWGMGEEPNRDELVVGKSIKCFDIPGEAQGKGYTVEVVQGEPQIVIQQVEPEERAHKRWND